ncbi:class I SAM-dependent methyltransferase [Niveibacterium sp. SC-1]|uniref:class I SAM-dependent methyltransferase n=1 Tax=Niveibacterium sp. SC-1 TaxID=3135646 RepID=UPI00311ED751
MTQDRSFADFERAGWEDAATAADYDRNLSLVTRQSIDALLDAAAVSAGARVLDVATGAGYVVEAAASRGARPLGIDFSDTQVRLARERYPGLQFECANAEALPFAEASFDAVVNAFGLCHLPHPAAALGEAIRVLRPGGRVAFSVWDLPERAIGFGAVYAAIRAHGSLDVGLPAGPDFFFFSHEENAVEALRAAGFVSPSFRVVEQEWRLVDPDALFAMVATSTVRAAATLRGQDPAAVPAIRAAVRAAVMAYRDTEGFALPMPAVIAAAAKPD